MMKYLLTSFLTFVILNLSINLYSQRTVDFEVFTNKLSFQEGVINIKLKNPIGSIRNFYMPDGKNWLFQGGTSAIYKYDGNKFSKVDYRPLYAEGKINYFYAINENDVYASTSKKLVHLKDGKVSVLFSEHSLKAHKYVSLNVHTITAACTNKSGETFIAGIGLFSKDYKLSKTTTLMSGLYDFPAGIYKIANGKTTRYNPLPKIKIKHLISSKNNTWAATDHKLLKFENEKWEVVYKSKTPDIFIRNLYVDKDDKLWLILNSKIGTFENGKFKQLKHELLKGLLFQSFAIDRNNVKWIGTKNYGLIMLGDNFFTQFSTDKCPITSNNIRKILIDKNNKVVVVAGNDIFTVKLDNRYFTNEYKFYSPINYNKPLNFRSIKSNGKDTYMCHLADFYKYENDEFKKVKTSDKAKWSDAFHDFDFDKDGNVWIVTSKYLRKLEGDMPTVFDKVDSKILNKVAWHITADKSGNVWIDSKTGLTKFDGANWTNYNKKNSKLPTNRIKCQFCDSKNNMWIATKKGLVKITDGEFTLWDKKNSVIGDKSIYYIKEDFDGNVWFSTEKKLAKYDGKEFIYMPEFEKFKVKDFFFYKDYLIGATNNGVLVYNLKTKDAKVKSHFLANKNVSFIVNIKNEVWIQTNDWRNANSTTASSPSNQKDAALPPDQARLMKNNKKFNYQYMLIRYPLDKLISE